MGKPTVKAIFCDMGNVAVWWFNNRTERLWQLAHLANPEEFPAGPAPQPITQQPFFIALQKEGVLDFSRQGEDVAWKLDTDLVGQSELYGAFLEAARPEQLFSAERFWMAYAADLMAIEPVCELLKELQQRGTTLIAATNTESWPADIVWRQTGLQFDGVVMSWKVGHKKPERGFFSACLLTARRVLHDDSLECAGCLLIDDIRAYCDAFKGIGGDAIQFKASQEPQTLAWQVTQLRNQLRERDLLK